MSRPPASISLDLDNQWSYMKTHGDAGWDEFPSYLDTVIPRFNSLLKELDITMTVFVVGQDAALEKNHGALSKLDEAGHEIGNHSFHHEPWLHLYSHEEVETEIATAEAAIEKATGVRPEGWRGPGFSFSSSVLETLHARNYKYDASTFPTWLGPLARAYYFMTAKMDPKERAKRKLLYGKISDALSPITPYRWKMKDGDLLEIPVTTMPLFRVPFHASYILYLATFSKTLALLYFKIGLTLCRLTRVEPSLLLHPLDFLGGDDVPCLDFFPAMGMSGDRKMALMRKILVGFKSQFDPMPMGAYAKVCRKRSNLPYKKLPPAEAHSDIDIAHLEAS